MNRQIPYPASSPNDLVFYEEEYRQFLLSVSGAGRSTRLVMDMVCLVSAKIVAGALVRHSIWISSGCDKLRRAIWNIRHMNINANNTILITGGGSGIGRGLAEAFHKLGNTVIIAGRRKATLDEVTTANPGMFSELVDVKDTSKLKDFASAIAAKYPRLNILINMAGIAKAEKLNEAPDFDAIDSTIATNLTAPLHLTAALLPLLKNQPEATIMTVTSGLAFTPLVLTPTYCATKAAMHSWSLSLRYQLKDTAVRVLELVPPYVQTELMGERQANDPNAMPLADFIAEVMQILATQPEANEILVKKVYPLRFAGDFDAKKFENSFEQFNVAMASH